MSPNEKVTSERRSEGDRLLANIVLWASRQPDIRAVAVVGSWARGTARMDSDLDVVILTDLKPLYLTDSSWIVQVTGEPVPMVDSQDWGPVTARRVPLASGLEVEFGFAPTSWARVEPLDEGTARVVAEGMLILHDPSNLLSTVSSHIRQSSTTEEGPALN